MAPTRGRGRVVTPERGIALDRLVSLVPRLDRPVLLVVDGGDGSGKTVLADELAARLPGAVRATLDDFHHPRAHRHAHGRTGLTVWERSFDLAAIRSELLDPWRQGAGATYRRRWHDLASDAQVIGAAETVPADGVLVVDGIFAQRPELVDAWDLIVYVDVPDRERVRRMAARDGVPDDPDHADQRRYLDAHGIYHATCRPEESAHVVVDNTDPYRPRVVVPRQR